MPTYLKAGCLTHRWDLTPKEAIAKQKELASQIRMQSLPEHFEVLGAADLAYEKQVQELLAVIVTFTWPTLQLLECVHVVEQVRFPYIPGLLSFREIPALLAAYQLLKQPPDVFLCDGQGLAHPRRLGLASHLGLCLQVPTVGCAKKRLCGEYLPLELRRGCRTPLVHNHERVGDVVCTRDGVKPVYVSPGHLSDFDSSCDLIIKCLRRYRLPEPLRLSHQMATRLRQQLVAIPVNLAREP
jgi:deoxyribonuclease V